jgi:carboxyl-terminal processing protease
MEPNEFSNIPPAPQPARKPRFQYPIALLLVIVLSFYFGIQFGRKGLTFNPQTFKIINQKDQVGTVDYNILWDAINTVNENYIDKPVDQQKVLYGAVEGAVSAAGDEYTTFFDPQSLNDFQTQLSGTFEGIGAQIGKKNGAITVIAPLDESPAKKAGLLPKDIITQVDGHSTADWSVDEAVKNIRGKAGTTVTLTIYRESKTNTFDVKIQRAAISVKSVKWEYNNVNGKNIAVVTLSQFGDDTKDLFNKAVNDILSHHVDGMILDLRNNPGGYLETAVDVASNWVPNGKVVVTEAHSNGQNIPYNSAGYGRLANIKTVVLINGGSASAAEILSGALQDYKIAPLIGEKSFGKGSVQQLFDLPGGTAVKVTIAKWITPSGKNLHKDGLVPDIAVTRSDDDIAADKDPQMDRAVQEITK